MYFVSHLLTCLLALTFAYKYVTMLILGGTVDNWCLLACPLYRGCPHFRESVHRGLTVFLFIVLKMGSFCFYYVSMPWWK